MTGSYLLGYLIASLVTVSNYGCENEYFMTRRDAKGEVNRRPLRAIKPLVVDPVNTDEDLVTEYRLDNLNIW
jgi:hypothetical protein